MQTQSSCPQTELKTKIAQMLMVGFDGLHLTKDNPIFSDIADKNIGGVILFKKNTQHPDLSKNIETFEQTQKLISDLKAISKTPLFVAIDQEGGTVIRIPPSFGASEYSAFKLGEINDLSLTRTEANKTSKALQKLGFNVNFAPCVDVALNPLSPIIAFRKRAFSDNPDIVIRHAEEMINVFKEDKILPVLKHFPGHGSAQGDTHLGYVNITYDWQEIELKPYQELLPKHPEIGVMIAHVYHEKIDKKYPLSLSYQNVTENLKNKLNFKGLTFTDDLQMGALAKQYAWDEIVIQAINAGNDVLVISNNFDYTPDIVQKTLDIVLKAISDGKISESRIDEAYARIIKTKQFLCAKD